MNETAAFMNNSNGQSLYTHFDHINPPIGRDGTPNAFYEAIRDEVIQANRPIGWSEAHGGFWMAAGYPEVMEVMHNTDAFSNDAVTFPRYGTTERLMLAGQDDPEHKRARLLVNEPFSPGRVMDFTKMLRENVNALIDGFIESGRADVAKIIGDPIPAILTAIASTRSRSGSTSLHSRIPHPPAPGRRSSAPTPTASRTTELPAT